jgi:hypothetical protein
MNVLTFMSAQNAKASVTDKSNATMHPTATKTLFAGTEPKEF